MTAWKRWQDYTTMVAGVLLFISPFVFGETSAGVAAGTAYVLGVLLFLSGVLAGAMREAGRIEIIPGVLGVVTFVSPWVLGFTGVAGIAWAAWIMGVVAALAAGSFLFARGSRMSAA
jgi:hypothetical protein